MNKTLVLEAVSEADSRPFRDTEQSANNKDARQKPPFPKWEFRPGDFSDAGAAAAFSAWAYSRLRFCPEQGWLRWSGTVWESGDFLALDEAIDFSSELLRDALDVYSSACKSFGPGSSELKRADAYRAFAVKERGAARIAALLELSKGALRVNVDALDADGFVLNTPGGIVDLRTGRIRPHDPASFCTHTTSVTPGNQGAELWREFLHDLTGGDDALAGYLQEVVGMAAVGVVLEETAVLFVGAGRNGKSTFLSSAAGVLGDYAGSMPVEVLTTARQNRGAVFAELRGKRLVLTGELEQGARLSVSTLKQLCSTDRVPCERKYHDPGSFLPSHTVVLASNFLPHVASDDAGTWRRLTVVPFGVTFTGTKERKNYAAYLVSEAGPAILEWAIEGATLFLRDGGKLSPPDAVSEATDAFRDSEDRLGTFFATCCETDSGASRTQARSLYQEYRAFCNDAGEYCGREREFSASMEARGFSSVNVHGVKFWLGIRVVRPAMASAYREFA